LEKYLVANGYNWDGTTDTTSWPYNKIAKSLASKEDWYTSSNSGAIGNDVTKNNKSGFSALTGGFRDYNGNYDGQSYLGFWWSATEYDATSAWTRYLDYSSASLGRHDYSKSCGCSVRLLRDSN
jgi:uncharacterized protein (TIGR02145 family)